MQANEKEWQAFLRTACFLKRLPPAKFAVLVRAFQAQQGPISAQALLEPFLIHGHQDPRVPGYLQQLLKTRLLSISDVLIGLLPRESLKAREVIVHEPVTQPLLFQMLSSEVSEGVQIEDLPRIFAFIVVWLEIFPSSIAIAIFAATMLSQPRALQVLQEYPDDGSATDAVGSVLASSTTQKVRQRLRNAIAETVNCINMQDMPLTTTLLYWQHELGPDLDQDQPESSNHRKDVESIAFHSSVMDNPLNTRAGLFVYLNALLHARPMFKDNEVMILLNARYKGEIASLMTDLIVAAFDVLANAMYRSDSAASMKILRSFLVNKLPVFLSSYAGMLFEPQSAELCISQALERLDPTAFPSVSQIGDLLGSSGTLSEAKQEFLFACALHSLLPEASIEILLGDVPMQSLPAGGRYVRDELVSQCTSHSSRIEELVAELDNLEGNSGEIAMAMLQIIQTLCSNNDTMTLKIVCTALSRRPECLDTMLFFVSLEDILGPLVNTLDTWQMHDEQGEHQLVYDEFGSILLLVMVTLLRFDINSIPYAQAASSFMACYSRRAHIGRSIQGLDERERKALGAWIRGLFETEGISDELMSISSPQEFHLGIATLFDQSIKACRMQGLSPQTVKSGFDFLLEPFLLPSLIAGLQWFGHRIWEMAENSSDLDTILPILDHLLNPPSISPDARALHSTVLSAVADVLDKALTTAMQRHPTRGDIGPLLETLRNQSFGFRRLTASFPELRDWCSAKEGLLGTLKSKIRQLAQWDIGVTDLSTALYTHGQLVMALQLLGSKAVLDTLLDEIVGAQSTSNNHLNDVTTGPANSILDIATMIIVAPVNEKTVSPSPAECLRDEASETFELSKTNMPRAVATVRLHRRVEALGSPPQILPITAAGAVGEMEGSERMIVPTIDDVLAQADHSIGTQGFINLDTDELMTG